jgi:hypothetical protein
MYLIVQFGPEWPTVWWHESNIVPLIDLSLSSPSGTQTVLFPDLSVVQSSSLYFMNFWKRSGLSHIFEKNLSFLYALGIDLNMSFVALSIILMSGGAYASVSLLTESSSASFVLFSMWSYTLFSLPYSGRVPTLNEYSSAVQAIVRSSPLGSSLESALM